MVSIAFPLTFLLPEASSGFPAVGAERAPPPVENHL